MDHKTFDGTVKDRINRPPPTGVPEINTRQKTEQNYNTNHLNETKLT